MFIKIEDIVEPSHVLQWFFDKTRSPTKSIILGRIAQITLGAKKPMPESKLLKILYDK